MNTKILFSLPVDFVLPKKRKLEGITGKVYFFSLILFKNHTYKHSFTTCKHCYYGIYFPSYCLVGDTNQKPIEDTTSDQWTVLETETDFLHYVHEKIKFILFLFLPIFSWFMKLNHYNNGSTKKVCEGRPHENKINPHKMNIYFALVK